jgi:hypothetical protein
VPALRNRTQVNASGLSGLCHDGDSISASAAALFCFPTRHAPRVRGRANNLAIAGATIATGTNNILNRINSVVELRPAVVTILIGTNDLADTVTYPATSDWLTALWNYCDLLKRRLPGVKIAVGTLMNRGDNATFTTRRPTANTGIIAGIGTHIDAVFDFAADATMGTDAVASNTALFNADKIHPLSVGQGYLDEIYRATVNTLFGIPNYFTGFTAASAGTDPHTLTGTFSHYWDPGDETTMLGGSMAEQINDQIGSCHINTVNTNKFPQSKTTQLRVNGLNTLYGHSASQMKSGTQITIPNNFHCFFCFYHDVPQVTTGYLLSLGDYTNGTPRISLFTGASQPQINSAGVGGVSITGSGGLATGTPVLYEIIGSGANLKLMKNGSQIGTSAAWTGWGALPVNVAFFTFGGAVGGCGRLLACGIADSELTGTTLTNTQSYFHTRWNF